MIEVKDDLHMTHEFADSDTGEVIEITVSVSQALPEDVTLAVGNRFRMMLTCGDAAHLGRLIALAADRAIENKILASRKPVSR